MGLVSNDLKNIVERMNDARISINSKYEIMRENNTTSPQDDIEHLYINDLSPSIDKIECLNSYGYDADPSKILEGTKVFVNGDSIIGTMPERNTVDAVLDANNTSINLPNGHYNDSKVKINIQEKECMPGTQTQVIEPDNEYLLSKVTVAGDQNLVSDNIKSGVSIFGVEGNIPLLTINEVLDAQNHTFKIPRGYTDGTGVVKILPQQKSCTPSTSEQIIVPDDKHVLSKVTVAGDADLISANIRKGVNIFNVTGTLQELTTYNIAYIVNRPKKQGYKQNVDASKPSFNIISSRPQDLEDCAFQGWSTNYADNNVMYTPGQQVTTQLAPLGDVCLLYAVWKDLDPMPLTMSLSYKNNAEISASKPIETVTATITGGNYGNGYSNITRNVMCDDAVTKTLFLNEGPQSYQCTFTFDEPGYYPIIVTHTTANGTSFDVSDMIIIKNEGDNMSGTGKMVYESNGSWYDSDWIASTPPRGCYIDNYQYIFQSSSGHSSTHDKLAIFGKKSNGSIVILHDPFNPDNVGSIVTSLDSLGTTEMNGGNKLAAITVGGVTLGTGNLNSTRFDIHNEQPCTLSDDIRQIRFFTFSDHSQSCFSAATIQFNVSYKYDANLYKQEANK